MNRLLTEAGRDPCQIRDPNRSCQFIRASLMNDHPCIQCNVADRSSIEFHPATANLHLLWRLVILVTREGLITTQGIRRDKISTGFFRTVTRVTDIIRFTICGEFKYSCRRITRKSKNNSCIRIEETNITRCALLHSIVLSRETLIYSPRASLLKKTKGRERLSINVNERGKYLESERRQIRLNIAHGVET